MTDDQFTVSDVLVSVEVPAELDSQAVGRYLCRFLDVEIETSSPGALETVYVRSDRNGSVSLATSVKLSNLRFRLKDLLLELFGTTLEFAGTSKHPVLVLLASLRLIAKLRSLAELDIDAQDAEVLRVIFRLSTEQSWISVDHVGDVLSDRLSSDEIARSLEVLANISCIALHMDGISLTELIVFDGP